MKNKERRPGAKPFPGAKAKGSGETRPAAAKPYASKGRDERQARPPRCDAEALKPKLQPQSPDTTAEPARALTVRNGDRPTERVPLILESSGAGDFHLIDSGDGLIRSLSHRAPGSPGFVAEGAAHPCMGQG